METCSEAYRQHHYFDKHTGTVSTQGTGSLNVDMKDNCFPVYNFRGMYLGYVQDNVFVKMTKFDLF